MFLLDSEKQHGWMDGIRQNLSREGGGGWWGRVRGKQIKKQLLNITALMTRLELNFPCPYLFCQM